MRHGSAPQRTRLVNCCHGVQCHGAPASAPNVPNTLTAMSAKWKEQGVPVSSPLAQLAAVPFPAPAASPKLPLRVVGRPRKLGAAPASADVPEDEDEDGVVEVAAAAAASAAPDNEEEEEEDDDDHVSSVSSRDALKHGVRFTAIQKIQLALWAQRPPLKGKGPGTAGFNDVVYLRQMFAYAFPGAAHMPGNKTLQRAITSEVTAIKGGNPTTQAMLSAAMAEAEKADSESL